MSQATGRSPSVALLSLLIAACIGAGVGRSQPAASAAPTTAVFSIGPGFTDTIPHQIIRTADDRVRVFAGQVQGSGTLVAYWTTKPGLPAGTADFGGTAQVTDRAALTSVDAVYDGGQFVHVLVATQAGALEDYPFDTSANAFRPAKTLASGDPTVTGDYIGTSGVSGAFDAAGTLHLAHWSANNHITYRAYTYGGSTDTLTPVSGPTQIDALGLANHPALAVSPVDDSITVAWVSQVATPAQILVSTRASGGAWGAIQVASTGAVWTSTSFGLSIDQGPSLLITAEGTKRLTYIENWDSTGNYGHVHYVENRGAGWDDVPLAAYSHDPALAVDAGGDRYIIGHGSRQNTSCTSNLQMCTIKQNTDGTWGTPQTLATPTGTDSFDSSPSVKWSVVGFNRSDTIEFLFFDAVGGSYYNTVLYYGRLPSASVTATATRALSATPSATPTSTATSQPTPTRTFTPTPTPSPTATSLATTTSVATSTPTPAPGSVLFSDGFEEASLAAGGWTLDVAGIGSSAVQVTAPVAVGTKAAGFMTLPELSGQHAFADAFFNWPASRIVEARGLVQMQLTSVQYTTKIFSLEDQGPYSWASRAGFGINAQDFVALLTNTNGVSTYVDTGVAYQNGQWYELAITVDFRTGTPIFTWLLAGTPIYTYVDTLGGPDQDVPVRLDVGLGPGNWGGTNGTVFDDAVVIWDPSGSLPTATPTVTLTAAPSATPTSTATRTATTVPTATLIATVTSTTTPSNVIFKDGFEEASFGAGGWNLDVVGTGSTAQLVTTPVTSGSQAGSFTTQTQQAGQRAFAQVPFAWPASKIVTAQGMVQAQMSTVGLTTKIFSLEDQGPYPWGLRAAFGINSQNFVAMLTDTSGAISYVDTGVPYVNGQWYQVALTVDLQSANPVFTFAVNGTPIYTYVDSLAGPDVDHPVRLDVGLGPGNWGSTNGTLFVDDVAIWDPSASAPTATLSPTLTPTFTSTSTPTATNSLTADMR
jgi:hypothetical protein